jgi:hypothetical protein
VLRSVLAVLAGYLIYSVPTVLLYQAAGQASPMRPTSGFVVGSALQGILFAFLGGYVAAWIAPLRDRLHAGVVALIIAAAALLQAWANPDISASGTQLTALFFVAPCAWLGGVLRSFQDEPRS